MNPFAHWRGLTSNMREALPVCRKLADLAGEGATVVILPLARAGVKCVRPRAVSQNEDAAPPEHTELWMDDVELDASAIILGEGRGLEISRARLETGRMHHCK